MSKKSGLWAATLLALIAIIAAGGGGVYYWLEIAKPYQQFLDELSTRGVTYHNIEEDADGTFNVVDARFDIGLAQPVAVDGLAFTKGREGYDLALTELSEMVEVLRAIRQRGVRYDRVVKDASGILSFSNPTLDVGPSHQAALGSFTAVKAQTGYDLTLEQLEVPLFSDAAKLTIALMEIKALEFADKIDQTDKGLLTPGFFAPFLHDKVESIRLENTRFSGSFAFGASVIAPTYTIGEVVLENIERGKMASYSDYDTMVSVNLDSEVQELTQMTGEVVTIAVARSKISDFNIKRAVELFFLAETDEQAPFEEIYSAFELEGYQDHAFDGTQTQYDRMTATAARMRGGKKAPIDFLHDTFAVYTLLITENNHEARDQRALSLLEDFITLFTMLGEHEAEILGIRQSQNISGIGPLMVEIARFHSHLKPSAFDVSYHDMKVTTNLVEASVGKIALEDFSHMRFLESLYTFFTTILDDGGLTEEVYTASLGLIPHFAKFSIEDFHLAAAQNSPLKDMIGEWNLGHITLTNTYDFDQALIPTTTELEIKDISVPAHIYQQMGMSNPLLGDSLSCMLEGHKSVDMNYRIRAQWDRQTRNLDFSDSFMGNNIFGTVGIGVQLGNIPPEFFSFNPLMKQQDYLATSLKNLHLTYDPQGQDGAFFACMGKEWNLDGDDISFVRELFANLAEDTVRLDAVMEPQLKPLRDVLVNFIKDGGKLVFSLEAKQPEGSSFDMLQHIVTPFDLFDVDLQSLP